MKIAPSSPNGDVSHGLDSLDQTIEFYQQFEEPEKSYFPEPLVALSTDEAVSTIALAGNQLFGDVTFLGQVHIPPQMKDSDYRDLYIGAAQARLFTELEKGEFQFVFCEGSYREFLPNSEHDPETVLLIREEFARLFPSGSLPPRLTKEQLVFFYNNPAEVVYAAHHPNVKLLGAEDALAHLAALSVAFDKDIPCELREAFIHKIRDAFITETLCRFFNNQEFRGEHVALILGSNHSMGMTEQLRTLMKLHSINELPLIVKKTFNFDVERCLYLDIQSWSDDLLYDSKFEACEQYYQVSLRPMLTWLAFESLDTTEAQLAGLPRLEVNKSAFPTAESLREWLMENRLIPTLINGKLTHISTVDVPKLFLKEDRFSCGEEAESMLFRERNNRGENNQQDKSSPSLRDLIFECFTKFQQGGILLGDPMVHLIEELYEKGEGPFSLYR